MQESAEVRGAMLRYYEAAGTADFDTAERLVTRRSPALVVGTGPGEGHDRREAWVAGFRSQVEALPGLRIEPGAGPRAYAEGPVGWFFDEPTWVLPDGTRIPTRWTSVLHEEDGDWRIVHMHVSLGVPDEKMGDVLGG